MQATLTWLDLTASDRDKMRRVLDLFKEQGTLDELGLGSLRDAPGGPRFPPPRDSMRRSSSTRSDWHVGAEPGVRHRAGMARSP